MTLNREQAIKIINLLDEVKAELTHFLGEFTTKKVEKTPNQQRAEIIENANKFVEDVINVGKSKYGPINKGNIYYKNYHFDVDFHLKNKKITALVFLCNGDGKRLDHKPVLLNRALCGPNDVFNEHIGKAIALGRALELDVSEFENAVQPTEVVVGHIIKTKKDGIKRVVLTDIEVDTIKGTCALRSPMVKHFLKSIINDTNATYSDSKEGK